jgi:hypothetical protein
LSSNDINNEKSDFIYFKEETYPQKVESTHKIINNPSFLIEKDLTSQKQYVYKNI